MWSDLINGSFELAGAVLMWLSVAKLYRDKQVKGVFWPATAFFSMWGFWNLFYYPHLGQWLSFAGSSCITIANTTWVVLAVYYTYRGQCALGR